MGYGEYDGGGSVKWRVEHDDGDFADGHADKKAGAMGRDKEPTANNAKMAVWVRSTKNGTWENVKEVECDKRPLVRIVWGKHYPGPSLKETT